MLNICLYDSGIGGLNVLFKLQKAIPYATFIYYGDNDYAPYGNKTEGEIYNRAYYCMDKLSSYNPKLTVIACNTISVICGENLKSKYPYDIILQKPQIKQYAEKTLITGTYNTLKHIDTKKLNPNIFTVYPLPSLAGDIENNIFNLNKLSVEKYFECVSKDYKNIILGCTHYPYVKDKIKKVFKNSKILDGISNTVSLAKKIVKKYEEENKDLAGGVIFIGDCAEKNEKVYKKYYK